MKSKPKIKIIKKNSEAIDKPLIVNEEKIKQTTTRNLVSTVSEWVNEFQDRRGEETRKSFDKLFSQRLQTGGLVTNEAS